MTFFEDLPRIQWYPGHIAKAQRVLQQRLAVVDVVIEVADARIPASSRFARAHSLIGSRPTVLVLAKPDLADPATTARWARELGAIAIEGRSGQGLGVLKARLAEVHRQVNARMKTRGRLPRAARAMVIGLPNVGKSRLTNRLAGGRKAITGDRPGVTRAPGWIRLAKDLELLDTPGLIPPRLEDRLIALKLAMLGAVPAEAYDEQEVARAALALLARDWPRALERFGGRTELAEIAEARRWLVSGEPDTARAAREVLHDIRAGTVGPLTLDPIGQPDAPARPEGET